MRKSAFRLGAVICVGTAVWAATAAVRVLAQQQQSVAGPNVNMVGGPALVQPGPPFKIEGDPYLQRQNEPSIACSSRNPLTCLAGANDYRLISAPGLAEGKVTGDAWLGVFWTRDDGQTWRSTAFPGFPQDTSAAGLASPIKGQAAAADPTIRAGTNGLFYYSGIAFSPAASTTAGSAGSEGKAGVMFVAVFIDDNNTQDLSASPRYIRTVITDDGTSGQFLDKPWIATDIPRTGAGTCLIPGSNGVPDQTVPAGNVYTAYSVFTGSGNNANSKLLFARSLDCGATWEKPTRLDPSTDISQSATISVNPVNGDILVSWRSFATPNGSAPGRILVAKSTDGGKSFGPALEVANLGLNTASVAFDLSTLPDPNVPNGNMFRMFRTNGYPAMCTDTNGLARIAWAQRGIGPQGDARILISSSTDGTTWSTPVAADNHAGRGHQLMPALACSATTASLVWYDQRDDNAEVLAQQIGTTLFGPLIADLIPPPPAHTLDVRAARAVGNAAFGPSIKVSRYNFALDTSAVQLIQLEFNPVNWPLFAGGQLPFIGDYLDLAPASPFRPPVGGSGWTYNTDTTTPPVFHATWTDNRDIVPSLNDFWSNWGPPGSAGCAQPTIRNQNVYSSRLSGGLVVGASGNSRLAGTVLRAYAVFVQNTTDTQRRFRLTTGQAPGGPASFKHDATLTTIDVEVPARSTVARTVFVSGSAAAIVHVVEIDASGNTVAGGLTSSTIVNSDPTAPPPSDTSIITNELHTVAMSNSFINTYQNPTFLNPTFLNPTFLNPTFLNPTFLNPTFLNPTFLNPTFLNPTFLNPTFLNPTFLNPTFLNSPLVTDISFQVTNDGNVPSGYNFNALLSSIPADMAFQLLVNRVYSTPGASNCNLGEQYNADTLLNVQNPTLTLKNPLDPSASNVSFALSAGDTAVVTLRAVHTGTFDPNSIGVIVSAQAPDTNGTISRLVMDKGAPVVTVPGTLTVEATSAAGAGVATYAGVSALDNIDGALTATCTPAAGGTFPIGDTTVTCSATDAAGNVGSASFTVRVQDTTPPVIAPHANVTVQTTNSQGTNVTYAPATTTDVVDGPGVATCAPASGSLFPVGTTTVTCAATDSHGNVAVPVTFSVIVNLTAPPVAQYGFIGVLNLPPPSGKTFKLGSSIPLQWRFTVNGSVVNSADAMPQIRISSSAGVLVFTPSDPGSSSFQAPTARNGYTWQFNWQSKDMPAGTYQIWVGSQKSGQVFANGTAFGPFTVIIK